MSVSVFTKTKRYLYLAFVGGYGVKFLELITTLTKEKKLVINAYLGDVDSDQHFSGSFEDPVIYVLCNKIEKMDEFLDYMKAHKSYAGDYEVDEDHHMLVVKIPKEHANSYKYFLQSKFSKMYSKTFLVNLFGTDKPDITKYKSFYVLMRDATLARKIADDLDVDSKLLKELDDAIVIKNETFNKLTILKNKQNAEQ